MLLHYLRTTRRHLGSRRFFSGINLLGLTIGLCVCFLAGLYVQFELSYDSYHQNADRIYRLVTDVETSIGVSYESTSAPMAPALQSAFAEVETATRVFLDYLIVQPEDRRFFAEETVAYADPSLFSVFTFPLVSGDAATALAAPLTVVVSETAAQRFFGTPDCVGETLLLDGNSVATVTGVMQDIPPNSHFRVDILVSMATLLKTWNPAMSQQWSRFGFYTYLLLPPSTDAPALGNTFTQYVRQHTTADASYALSLEPLTRVYLTGKARGSRTGSSSHGNIRNVYVVATVALLVLFIACFNFVNLTTALSLQRTKEVSVRRVLGASRRQLMGQFLLDAALLSLLASGLALLLSAGLLPWFNQLVGTTVRTSIVRYGSEVGWLLVVALLVGGLSGSYPAWWIAGHVSAGLRDHVTPRTTGRVLQRTLIVMQFAVAIILMVATAVVYRQLHYLQTSDPGFAKEQRVVVDFHFDPAVTDRSSLIKQRLTSVAGVSEVSLSSSVPGRVNRKYVTALEDGDHTFQELMLDAYFVDYDFLEQYDIDLVAGRGFSTDRASDTTEAMLVNQAAARHLGYPDPAAVIGQRFEQQGRQGTVVGVVRDFHVHSFREAIPPLALRVSPGFNLYTFATLSISSRDVPATISRLEDRWEELVPGQPFAYFFLDEHYDRQYAAEVRFRRLFTGLAAVAIILSCLGLVALSTLSAVRRTQEVGIRKVLGASVPSVVRLLTQDFLGLVLVAIAIGLPVAGWLANQWLQTFAYRVNVPGWLLLGVGLATIFIAVLTVGFQAVRAARVNPVDSLRSE